MKTRLMTIAAALAIAATASWAQQFGITASVPFPFTAGSGKVLPAGDYLIPAGTGPIWRLIPDGSGTGQFVAGWDNGETKPTDKPKLVFECLSNHCMLREIQLGYGNVSYRVNAPKSHEAEEQARVVVIPATLAR